ncbi:hypothetical protein V8B55DRAFT_1593559 [Mucor lusitanicus]
MPASEDRLPVEVWLNIFDRIPDKQQLVQCKLVCKRWAPLVEKAMLKTVVVTKENTFKLYNYLKDHAKANRYIQVIDIADYSHEDLTGIFLLLSAAITPNLREINGSVLTMNFIDTIADVVARLPADSVKLQKVPGTALSNDGYVSLVYTVRKTLRFLHIGLVRDTTLGHIAKVCGHLHEFESLRDLRLMDLKKYIDSIWVLDSMLRGCLHLQNLLVLVDQSPTRRATNNLDAWLSQNVQKVDSLKSLTIKNAALGHFEDEVLDLSSGFNVDLLRYLSFKYPKVQHVEMDFYEQLNQPIPRSLFENAETVTLREWRIDTMEHAEQINMANYINENFQRESPLVLLQSTPFIEQLKVNSNNLDYGFPLAPLTQLHTLALEDVYLTAEDIAAIASWAPQLKHLTLTSCKFTRSDNFGARSMSQEILVPELALSTLSVRGSDMRTQDMYISLEMPGSQSHLLYAAPSRPLVQTTFEECMMYFSETTALIIECKSLKHLSVRLNSIRVEIEFDEDGNAMDLSTDIASLKAENQALATKYEQAKKYLTEAQIQAIEEPDL